MQDKEYNGYLFSANRERLAIDRIAELLGQSYWAQGRSRETIVRSINHSLCFAIYKDGYQIGFARVVTDYATMFWLSDVFIDKNFRGQGLGKKLVEYVLSATPLKELNGILGTKDAHGLYEQYGFQRDPERLMRRRV
ncbi:MAG TPA: GNAT family N-acetyltransferase [Patescibacteria group bacterium]|nr:GNAT family N-acetyltransferase [Patescibacteria group bacterium]